ncbi:MAG: 6,7-dimethyl-8-ribityllumazine synthase [Ignavibacteria bacterium]|nr:6,7-dimethyl-8-ribityllumazine synthase [Ignavibacteria bacterium]
MPLYAVHPNGKDKRIAIVASRWHEELANSLVEAAVTTLISCGTRDRDIEVIRVPGAFEIPVTVAALARTHRFDAVIALGIVIRGETAHFEFIAGPVANSLQSIAIDEEIPCVFGVLTTDTEEQARERSGGRVGNKGVEAAYVALEMSSVLHEIHSGLHHA